MSGSQKSAQSWPLRFQDPISLPNVAKFGDPINWTNVAKPVYMYLEDEQLKEEEVVEGQKDSEYYKRKRRRNIYKKKDVVVLENETNNNTTTTDDPTQIRYHGKICNLGLAEQEAEQASGSTNAPSAAPFKYVLLQCVKQKDATTGEVRSEFNVIPVNHTFAFHRRGLAKDELEEEIEKRKDQEDEQLQILYARYKGINTAIANSEKQREMREMMQTGEGQNMGLEGAASIFGAAANKALKGKGKKNNQNKNIQSGVRISETGLDLDELEEHNFCGGDYTTRFADDEEDQVIMEQQQLDDQEARELSAGLRFGEESEADDSNDDDDSDPDEEEEEEGLEKGMVDNTMVSAAALAAKQLFKNQDKKPDGLPKRQTGATTENLKSALKRARTDSPDPHAQAPTAIKDKNTSSAQAQGMVERPGKKAKGAAEEEGLLAQVGSQEDFPLSEQGVRMFLVSRGGRAALKDTLEAFKPKIKIYSKKMNDKKAGKDRFLDILELITETREDPVRGQLLTLKN